MSSVSRAIAPDLLPEVSTNGGIALRLACIALGVVALTVSAKLHVPMWPVPMTMQTFMVLVVGMTFGSRIGVATLLAYVFVGALGLNVFSGTGGDGPSGVAYIAGPTGGYILGFVVAGWLAGVAAEMGWDRSIALTCLTMTAGTVLIFAFGIAWMAHLFAAERGMEWVLATALIPFLPGAVVKIALAALIVPGMRRVASARLSD